jgi:hypothetical protein
MILIFNARIVRHQVPNQRREANVSEHLAQGCYACQSSDQAVNRTCKTVTIFEAAIACIYLAGRFVQHVEVSAVTSCPKQQAHSSVKLEIVPVGQTAYVRRSMA